MLRCQKWTFEILRNCEFFILQGQTLSYSDSTCITILLPSSLWETFARLQNVSKTNSLKSNSYSQNSTYHTTYDMYFNYQYWQRQNNISIILCIFFSCIKFNTAKTYFITCITSFTTCKIVLRTLCSTSYYYAHAVFYIALHKRSHLGLLSFTEYG